MAERPRQASPTSVAFFSDVHANLPALRAALADVERRGATVACVAGDLVSDGPHPSEVFDLLRSSRVAVIAGNVERKVVALAAGGKRDLVAMQEKKKRGNLAWTVLQLDRRQLAWLAALRSEIEITLGDTKTLVVHGSPLGDTDYLFASITAPGLASKLTDPSVEVLVSGHSHVPFVRRVASVLVINCGSVGRPADGDPRGSYALARLQPGRLPSARIVRFAYPVGEVARAVVARSVPGIDPAEYLRGVKAKRS
jgi:predicted phosphodiesterase